MIARLGLGCSRLGSVTGLNPKKSEQLLLTALALGIRLYDTSDIYGQGESERILGRVMMNKPPDLLIFTKAGQVFPRGLSYLLPVKSLASSFVRTFGFGRRKILSFRARPLQRDFSKKHLSLSAEKSIRRLKVDALDAYLLHSPSSEVLKAGDAVRALEDLKLSGKIRRVGVSCENFDTVFDALGDDRIEVIQFPVSDDNAMRGLYSDPRIAKRMMIGRGVISQILSNEAVISRSVNIEFELERIMRRSFLDYVLVGTTNIRRLASIVSAADAASANKGAAV